MAKQQSVKIINLREALISYVHAEFPSAIVETHKGVTYIGFNNEVPRVVFAPGNTDSLIVYISKDLDKMPSLSTSNRFILSSRSSLEVVKSAIKTIMSLQKYSVDVVEIQRDHLPELPEGQAYLVDNEYNLISIVEVEVVDDEIDEKYETFENEDVIYSDGSIPTIMSLLRG